MIKIRTTFKPRPLDGILFIRLKELEQSSNSLKNKNFINYSYVYEKICRNLSIKKLELKKILEEWNDLGFIEISSVGIKLQYQIENEE